MKHLTIALLLMLPVTLAAETVTLSWEPPTTRTNGEPLPANEIDAYIIRQAPDEDGPFHVWATVPGTHTTFTKGRDTGKYCYEVYTQDADGLQSEPSNVACKFPDTSGAQPSPPTDVKVSAPPAASQAL